MEVGGGETTHNKSCLDLVLCVVFLSPGSHCLGYFVWGGNGGKKRERRKPGVGTRKGQGLPRALASQIFFFPPVVLQVTTSTHPTHLPCLHTPSPQLSRRLSTVPRPLTLVLQGLRLSPGSHPQSERTPHPVRQAREARSPRTCPLAGPLAQSNPARSRCPSPGPALTP